MKSRLPGRNALAIAVLMCGWMMAPAASAFVIYDWSGDCTAGITLNCSGSSSATLTLADAYTPGDALAFTDFVAFDYLSSSGSYSVPSEAPLFSILGTLPALSGASVVDVIIRFTDGFSEQIHRSNTDGSWTNEFDPSFIFNQGSAGMWTLRTATTVPEPGTLGLLGIGLLALGLTRRRRA